MAPGELVPEGECPECGALCHQDGRFVLESGMANSVPIVMYGGLDGGDMPIHLPLERSWLGKSAEDGNAVLVLSFSCERIDLASEASD